jgi:hypothetical protein
MRSLFLLYILFVLFSGGLLAEYLLKEHWWRWLALFLPLSAGMFYAQRALFPASAHVEWPWAKPRNPWVQAFNWVRDNTPTNAVFSLDPYYMHVPGEDEDGFRDIAERSMMADQVTDGGAVSMFPPLGDEWAAQMQARSNWHSFQPQDYQRLHAQYGVNWVILQQTDDPDLQCPYQNEAVRVCKVE